MAGDLLKHLPGERVEVHVVADANGDVAVRGDGVELAGEDAEYTQVQQTQATEGYGVGMLLNEPEDYDENVSYSSGEVVGQATLFLTCPVIYVTPADSYTASVGDQVAWADAGQVVQQAGVTATGLGGAVTNTLGVDGNGNLETNASSDIDVSIRDGLPYGEVFSTVTKEFGPGQKVQVAVYR